MAAPTTKFRVGGKVPKSLQKAVNRGKQRKIFDKPSFDAMTAQAKTDAFTVAGNLTNDAIGYILQNAQIAVKNGRSYDHFKKSIPDSTFRNIAAPEVVLQNAAGNTYQRSRFNQQNRLKKLRPYWRYETFQDERVRPNHAIMHGIVAPAGSDFWAKNYPPNGHRCRCAVSAHSTRAIKRRKWKPVKTLSEAENLVYNKQIEAGISPSDAVRPLADPGWRGAFKPNGEGTAQAILDAFKIFPGKKWASMVTKDPVPAPVKKTFKAQAKKTVDPPKVPVQTADDIVGQAQTINFDDFEQIGGQGGSNVGGLFKHKQTGEKWYIKKVDLDHSRNEVLGGRLYNLAGVESPELQLATSKGKHYGVASRYVEGLKKSADALKTGKVGGVAEGYGADAWLSNWDVVGLEYDNMLTIGHGKTLRVIRIDPGGSLKYRAQGTAKGKAFGDKVTEIQTLLDPSVNSQAASVFKNYSQTELKASLKKITKIKDDDIRKVIQTYGPGGREKNVELANKMIKRKHDIAKQINVEIDPPNIVSPKKKVVKPPKPDPVPAAPGPVDPPPAAPGGGKKKVTKVEAKEVDKARSNGYELRRDKDQIEDQGILFWESIEDGNKVTRAQLKLTEGHVDKLDRLVKNQTIDIPSTEALDRDILAAVKGIKKQEGLKETIRAVDKQRVDDATAAYNKVRGQIKEFVKNGNYTKKALADFDKAYKPWINSLDDAAFGTDAQIGQPAVLKRKGVFEGGHKLPKPSNIKQDEILPGFTFEKVDTQLQAATFKDGNAILTKRFNQAGGSGSKMYRAVNGDTTVEVWVDKDQFANYGKILIKKAGKVDDVGGDILGIVDKIGVDLSTPTALDAEELYLRKLLYYIDTKGADAEFKLLANTPDPKARVKALKDRINGNHNNHAKVPIDKLPDYNPQGHRQIFNQGRVVWECPKEVLGPELDAFENSYRIWYNNTNGNMVTTIENVLQSGGQMASTTDKLRRGIPWGGMSPSSDVGTGGADYFFTRIVAKSNSNRGGGFVWKPKTLRRLDSITYQSDQYGQTSGGNVVSYRLNGVNGWKRAAGNSSNETNFKGTLSILEDLEKINAGSATEKKAIIEVFKRNGWDQFPDGRALNDVIKVKGQ